MTNLEPKQVRDAKGISSFERGLVYAALGLRYATTRDLEPDTSQINTHSNAVRIGIVNRNVNVQTSPNYEDELAMIKIQAKLPYHRSSSLISGGSFMQYVKSLSHDVSHIWIPNENQSLDPLPSDFDQFTMPDDPDWVYMLEHYFLWTATEIERHYYQMGLAKNDFLKNLMSVKNILVEDNPLVGYIEIDATLPMYYLLYLRTQNLLMSVHSVINKYLEW